MKKISAIILVLALIISQTGCITTASEPLQEAIIAGEFDKAKTLMEKGININEINVDGERALIYAANKGKIKIVKLLLDKGANVNIRCIECLDGQLPGATALIYAAANGDVDMARLLIDKGADIEAIFTNKKGGISATPLVAAAFSGNTYLMKLLVERGANVEKALGMWRSFRSKTDDPKTISTIDRTIALFEKFVEEQKSAQQPKISSSLSRKDVSELDKPAFGAEEKIMGDNDLAVVIGIEGYQNLPKSDYSYDDARLVKEYLKSLGFKERNIEFIADEKATKSSIEKSIESWLPNKVRSHSRVFVYYSGHGAPDPQTGDAYLVPFDGDPNYLTITGYPLKRLYDKLGKLQVAEVVVVLDACFSGAGGRSVIAKGTRPLVMTSGGITLSQNVAILSATQGTQITTSSNEKGHGIFTYYFLKALKDGKKNIAEIYKYIKPLVEDEAKMLNVQQSPSLNPDPEKIKGRFSLRK